MTLPPQQMAHICGHGNPIVYPEILKNSFFKFFRKYDTVESIQIILDESHSINITLIMISMKDSWGMRNVLDMSHKTKASSNNDFL